jgi:hypothetical protein
MSSTEFLESQFRNIDEEKYAHSCLSSLSWWGNMNYELCVTCCGIIVSQKRSMANGQTWHKKVNDNYLNLKEVVII